MQDGSALTDAEEQPTVLRPGVDPNKTEQLPLNVTQAAQPGIMVEIPTPPHAQPAFPTHQTQAKGSPVLKIVLAIVILGLLVVLGAGVLGAVLYFYSGSKVIVSETPTPVETPQPLPTSSPVDDKKKLEDEIAKLKKQLEDSTNSNIDVTIDDDFSGFGKKATVNSPKDGFLALRSLPSTDFGDRIAKIPHGATISIVMCSDQSVTIGGRTGHWCMATYENKTGWVFDVWLDY